jgi:mannose-1-phosphate guanylyltransferase
MPVSNAASGLCNRIENSLHGVQVAILAGGLGTRIRGVLGDTPKVLAPVGDKTYLDHLIADLKARGVTKVTLMLGHLADKVIAHCQAAHYDLPVDWVVEPQPLGTGGAVRFAREKLVDDPVLVMNGDTWLQADYAAFLRAHKQSGRLVTLLCVQVENAARYGRVVLDEDHAITAFQEKDPNTTVAGVINGGVYLLSQAGLDALCATHAASLEKDFFEQRADGTLGAFVADNATFIDIGTPESLKQAPDVFGSGHLVNK